MRKERKHYMAEEKVAVLRRRLLDKVPVSDLCEEYGLQPMVFYRWQKEFFEFLKKKIQTKDDVLAELMAEHIALKKVLGSSNQGVGAARCGTWWWSSTGANAMVA